VAVYAIQLQQLARLQPGARHEFASLPVDNPDRSAVLGPKAAPTTLTHEAECARDMIGELPLPLASADHLLGLSPSQLAAYVAQPGGSGSKVLLAIMYRLATIERQMDDLGSYLRGRSAGCSFPAAAAVVQTVVGGADKAEVLEQVFRKNLSLRGTT